MAGTKAGGKQAAITNTTNEPAFYKRIGAKGGAASNTGGWAANRELASKWGRVGGSISRKDGTPKLTKTQIANIRRRLLEEQSQMQTSRLSEKYGVKRSW